MAKKKWTAQRDAYMDQILSLLRDYENTLSIRQENYKRDFFKVFADAFQSRFCTPSERFDETSGRMVQCKAQRPLVTADAIWNHAVDQKWCHAEMGDDEKRYRDIQLVMMWWEEWTYAWEWNPPKRKRSRTF